MNPPTTIILHMTSGETLTFIGSEVTLIDQCDEKGVFARSIAIKGVQSAMGLYYVERKKYRRKVERRTPKAGVNVRHNDDETEAKTLKRIRRGKK